MGLFYWEDLAGEGLLVDSGTRIDGLYKKRGFRTF